jgi:hypothetical protein
MADPDPQSIARSLYQRRQSSAVVPFEPGELQGWRPDPAFCHDNVARFVQECPDHRRVRGWIVRDNSDIDLFWFYPHSVVEDPSGVLFDITPPRGTASPFLKHQGSDADFDALVTNLGLNPLIYRIGT